MMVRRFHIVLALTFASIATFLGYTLLFATPAPTESNETEVPVAARPIPAMAEIGEQDVAWIRVPAGALDAVAFLRRKEEIVGSVVAHAVAQGSLFTEADLLDEETVNPFHLPEGYRAVTVENSPVVGLGGHLRAGMFVDIVWIRQDGTEAVAQLAFQNIKVLAVGSPGAVSLETNETAKTVTLMMTAEDAVELSLRAQTGTLAFGVRPSPTDPPIDLGALNVGDWITP